MKLKVKRFRMKPLILEREALKGVAKNRDARKNVEVVAKRKLDLAMQEMIREFNEHPITMELEAGPEADNISGTLSGYGNLFSFIGFHEEEDPVELVRQLLMQFTLGTPRITAKRKMISFSYRTTGMTRGEIFAKTRLSWIGKSWLQAIESGMSGLGNYLYYENQDYLSGNSRSGTAVQASKRIRSGGYKPTRYLTAILRNFERNITNKR